jgi:hypothetical protein
VTIDVIDRVDVADQKERRKNMFNTPRFHASMHCYKPEQNDEMHCHNADQTFYVIDGECAMRFPDGAARSTPTRSGRHDHGGSFYHLESAGSEPMIMMVIVPVR